VAGYTWWKSLRKRGKKKRSWHFGMSDQTRLVLFDFGSGPDKQWEKGCFGARF